MTEDQAEREEDLTLFHVSAESYQAGDVIGPFSSTRFHDSRHSDEDFAATARAFAAGSFRAQVSRKTAIFAFGDILHCASYWDSEARRGTTRDEYSAQANYYEIAADESVAAPFALPTHVLRRIQAGLPVEEIVREYWSPGPRWRLLEYLSQQARVVRVLEPPSREEMLFSTSMTLLGLDMEEARRRWPLDDPPASRSATPLGSS